MSDAPERLFFTRARRALEYIEYAELDVKESDDDYEYIRNDVAELEKLHSHIEGYNRAIKDVIGYLKGKRKGEMEELVELHNVLLAKFKTDLGIGNDRR